MAAPSRALLRRMAKVAEQRAAGASWEVAAAAVQRRPETCRGWVLRYPEHWRVLYQAAERCVMNLAFVEALIVLQDLS